MHHLQHRNPQPHPGLQRPRVRSRSPRSRRRRRVTTQTPVKWRAARYRQEGPQDTGGPVTCGAAGRRPERSPGFPAPTRHHRPRAATPHDSAPPRGNGEHKGQWSPARSPGQPPANPSTGRPGAPLKASATRNNRVCRSRPDGGARGQGKGTAPDAAREAEHRGLCHAQGQPKDQNPGQDQDHKFLGIRGASSRVLPASAESSAFRAWPFHHGRP